MYEKNNGSYYSGEVVVEFETVDEGFYFFHTLDVDLEFNEVHPITYSSGPILSSIDYEEDEEHDLAGKLIMASLIVYGDINLENNVDWNAVKHWSDGKEDYIPTLAEVDVSCIHSYRKISDDRGLEYLETFFDYYDLEDFHDDLNNRMGWVFKLGFHLHTIINDIKKIILETYEFALAVAAILSGWFTSMTRTETATIESGFALQINCTKAALDIVDVVCVSDNITVTVSNIGSVSLTNPSIYARATDDTTCAETRTDTLTGASMASYEIDCSFSGKTLDYVRVTANCQGQIGTYVDKSSISDSC